MMRERHSDLLQIANNILEKVKKIARMLKQVYIHFSFQPLERAEMGKVILETVS